MWRDHAIHFPLFVGVAMRAERMHELRNTNRNIAFVVDTISINDGV
jgi:hypothetical protein